VFVLNSTRFDTVDKSMKPYRRMSGCIVAWVGLVSLFPPAVFPRFQVQLRLCVEGEYRSTHAPDRFHGKYRCILNARAGLERDNGDYILYQLEKREGDDSEVVWTEWNGEPGTEQACSLDDCVHPQMEVRFALREQGKVVLDFLVGADVQTPGLERLKRKFTWPRGFTAAGGDPEERYRQGIYQGSNRVEWLESAMKQSPGVQGERNWSWKEVHTSWTHTQRVQLSFLVAPETGAAR
jgi:hypothetical protein